jgi:hypothetical protein
VPLRRLLRSAERFSETAILCGSIELKTFVSRSSASLCCVTLADQRFDDFLRVLTIASVKSFRAKRMERMDFSGRIVALPAQLGLEAERNLILISDVSVRWTGHFAAISINLACCSVVNWPVNSTSTSILSSMPSFVAHSSQSLA